VAANVSVYVTWIQRIQKNSMLGSSQLIRGWVGVDLVSYAKYRFHPNISLTLPFFTCQPMIVIYVPPEI
jgi:hypothetical protein